MRNIRKFLDAPENAAKKAAFEKAGKDFNEKYSDKYEKQNLSKIEDGNAPEFVNKWGELSKTFQSLQVDTTVQARCFICEKQLNSNFSTDVDHYRPKWEKSPEAGKIPARYWWLAYDYKNYCLTCAICNRAEKNDKFPLKDDTKRVSYEKKDEVGEETPLLINPMTDDPNEYFDLVFIVNPQARANKCPVLLPRKGLKESDPLKYEKAVATLAVYKLDLRLLEYTRDYPPGVLDRKAPTHWEYLGNDSREHQCKVFTEMGNDFLMWLYKEKDGKSEEEFQSYLEDEVNANRLTRDKASTGLVNMISIGQAREL